jgi:hypothetical protein
MVKERYTGFQLNRVNDSCGLNTDDIDYALTANVSNVSLYTILSGLYKPLYLVSFSFCAKFRISFVNIFNTHEFRGDLSNIDVNSFATAIFIMIKL